jgi:putative RNA 2'-phosphotransferase
MNDVTLSKFLSLVLRHKPEEIGLTLDSAGWADVEELLRLAAANGTAFDRVRLLAIVAASDKQRFALSADGQRIRANQGHSRDVELGLAPREPPDVLFHGTATRFLESILAHGLLKGDRQHVHLSPDSTTAIAVGRRHGKPLVLEVNARAMAADGMRFFLSANGVWLTERVPAAYLRVV